MTLNDNQIAALAGEGMIEPFTPQLIRQADDGRRLLSFGLSSYGYDLTLSAAEFLIFRHVPGTVIDPKQFRSANLEPAPLHTDERGQFFIIPGHSYGLGVARERLAMPADVTGICLGKSTYARVGLIANMTPVEAGWVGHLTLEFSNASAADCRIYANEGVCQVLFFRGEPCGTCYATRAGKYQGQVEAVTLAKV